MNSIYSGIAISLGCWIYLSVPNKILGALLFSCGLLAVRIYHLKLFTGKCQFILKQDFSFLYYFNILILNLIGVCIMAGIAPSKVHEAAHLIALAKNEQTFWSALSYGLGCGALMSLATYKESPLWVSSLCVVAFILSGFNHCIADAFYMLAGGLISFNWIGTLLGNIIGGALFTKLFKDEI